MEEARGSRGSARLARARRITVTTARGDCVPGTPARAHTPVRESANGREDAELSSVRRELRRPARKIYVYEDSWIVGDTSANGCASV